MKVAILNITAGGISGGYKKYLENVIPRIAGHPEVEAIFCALPESADIRNCFGLLPNVEFVSYRFFHFFGHKIDFRLRQGLENFSPDVIFIPAERFLKFRDVPVVNMVQNMEPFVKISGNPLEENFRNWIRRLFAEKSLRQSNRIIAPSEYVRNFLINILKINKNKIGLVYHGVEAPEKDLDQPLNFPKKWTNSFLFTAGSIRPARGLEDLLSAYKSLSDRFKNFPALIIAGEVIPRMIKYSKKLDKWIKFQKLSSKVYLIGKLNKKEMSWCYKNCQMFIMTSYVESFGMVAAEALAHGCLCLSSDSSCLPEIFDKAAVFYPTKNSKILAEKINEILNWPEEKKQLLRQQALVRASQFSWDKCAKQTVDEFKKAISKFSSHG